MNPDPQAMDRETQVCEHSSESEERKFIREVVPIPVDFSDSLTSICQKGTPLLCK